MELSSLSLFLSKIQKLTPKNTIASLTWYDRSITIELLGDLFPTPLSDIGFETKAELTKFWDLKEMNREYCYRYMVNVPEDKEKYVMKSIEDRIDQFDERIKNDTSQIEKLKEKIKRLESIVGTYQANGPADN